MTFRLTLSWSIWALVFLLGVIGAAWTVVNLLKGESLESQVWEAYSERGEDPWGNKINKVQGTGAYSAGPNAINELGRGDDVWLPTWDVIRVLKERGGYLLLTLSGCLAVSAVTGSCFRLPLTVKVGSIHLALTFLVAALGGLAVWKVFEVRVPWRGVRLLPLETMLIDVPLVGENLKATLVLGGWTWALAVSLGLAARAGRDQVLGSAEEDSP
ncbi:MAG: hypothetical protein CMF76_00560 [Maricaulis sp.]|nr:hypothetical protein [Maricaulis sp.]